VAERWRAVNYHTLKYFENCGGPDVSILAGPFSKTEFCPSVKDRILPLDTTSSELYFPGKLKLSIYVPV